MYETMGRALKTYEKSVLTICCLSKWVVLVGLHHDWIIACAVNHSTDNYRLSAAATLGTYPSC